MPPPQGGAPLGEGNLIDPTGITWEEPPPEITPMSAWPPITAIFLAEPVSGRSPPSFFSSTIPASAARCETAASALASRPPAVTGWSMTPVANRLRSTRCAI